MIQRSAATPPFAFDDHTASDGEGVEDQGRLGGGSARRGHGALRLRWLVRLRRLQLPSCCCTVLIGVPPARRAVDGRWTANRWCTRCSASVPFKGTLAALSSPGLSYHVSLTTTAGEESVFRVQQQQQVQVRVPAEIPEVGDGGTRGG